MLAVNQGPGAAGPTDRAPLTQRGPYLPQPLSLCTRGLRLQPQPRLAHERYRPSALSGRQAGRRTVRLSSDPQVSIKRASDSRLTVRLASFEVAFPLNPGLQSPLPTASPSPRPSARGEVAATVHFTARHSILADAGRGADD